MSYRLPVSLRTFPAYKAMFDGEPGESPYDPNRLVDFFFWHELNQARDKVVLSKTLPEKDYRTKFQELHAKYGAPFSEDPASVIFQERGKKPVGLFCKYKGPWIMFGEFIDGKQMDDGMTVTEVTPKHPRTWVAAYPGAYGNPPMMELDQAKALAMAKAGNRFREIREVATWEEFLRIVKAAEDERATGA